MRGVFFNAGIFAAIFIFVLLSTSVEAAQAQPTNLSIIVDGTPPFVYIASPQNISYSVTSIPLNYTVYDLGVGLDKAWYSLDNGINNTLAGNTTIVVSDGTSHTLTLYANDTLNHINSTSVTFYVESVLVPSPPSGGGGVATKPSVQKEDFLVSPAEIKVSLKQGESKQLEIIITNLKNYAFNLTLSTPELGNLMKINPSQTVLGAWEIKAIYLNFSAGDKTTPNTYIGHLIIKGPNVEKDVLVTIDVQSKKVLLDVIANIPQESAVVAPGQELSVELKFYNLGGGVARDALAEYIIRDVNGNVVFALNETLTITKEEVLLKKIVIPENLKLGTYVFSVRVTYGENIATSSAIFTVSKKPVLSKEAAYLLIAAFILIFIAALVALIRRIFVVLAIKKESLYSLGRTFNRRTLRWAGARLYIEKGYRKTEIYLEPRGSTIFIFIDGFKDNGKMIPVGAITKKSIHVFFRVLSKGEVSRENYKILKDINNARISGTKILLGKVREITKYQRRRRMHKKRK